jgi:hypothetical protein
VEARVRRGDSAGNRRAKDGRSVPDGFRLRRWIGQCEAKPAVMLRLTTVHPGLLMYVDRRVLLLHHAIYFETCHGHPDMTIVAAFKTLRPKGH